MINPDGGSISDESVLYQGIWLAFDTASRTTLTSQIEEQRLEYTFELAKLQSTNEGLLKNNAILETEANEDDLETYYLTYTVGSVSIGAQKTKVDAETAASDIERDAYGISFVVNENLSVGVGKSDVEYDAAAKTMDEESREIGAVYTSGGMTVGFQNIKKDGINGTTVDHEMNELQLTFAF